MEALPQLHTVASVLLEQDQSCWMQAYLDLLSDRSQTKKESIKYVTKQPAFFRDSPMQWTHSLLSKNILSQQLLVWGLFQLKTFSIGETMVTRHHCDTLIG